MTCLHRIAHGLMIATLTFLISFPLFTRAFAAFDCAWGPDAVEANFKHVIDDPDFKVDFPKFQNDFDKIQWVNNYVNHLFPYNSTYDFEMKKPSEDVIEGGDCKDYSVTKYVLLRRLGFKAADLRIAWVSVFPSGGHAILLVHSEGSIYILDSIIEDGDFAPIRHTNPSYAFIRGRQDYLFNEEQITAPAQ